MKKILLFILGVIFVVTGVVFIVAYRNVNQEELSLTADLQYRTRLLSDSLKEAIEPVYNVHATTALQKIVDRFANRERLVGFTVYNTNGEYVAGSATLTDDVFRNLPIIASAMDTNEAKSEFMKSGGKNLYILVDPIHDEDRVSGALMIVQNASYITDSVLGIWKNNFLPLLFQVVVFSTALFSLIRWGVYKPMNKLAETVKLARTGEKAVPFDSIDEKDTESFFSPLAREISKISRSLIQARFAASEEARLRSLKLDTPWTSERLKEFVKAHLGDRKIFLVSNREPYAHYKTKNGIEVTVPASGVVTAIESIMKACGGLWLAHGSGDADRLTVDKTNKIAVPPDEPKYTLKRVWLTEKEVHGYYTGFSNEALWPLCHVAHIRPTFRKEDWREYRRVNNKFAQNLLAEIEGVERPLILVQDFHFALLPKIVKASRPDAQICLFWHVPFPNAESFSICPFRREILEGMLGSDILGFHTQQHCNNFMDTVGKEVESLIDLERFAITREGHTTHIKAFPISIAFAGDDGTTKAKADPKFLEELNIKTKYVGLGVDRLDYTKGILERFKAVEFFLEAHPEYKKQFTFLQIAPPSRESVEEYRQYGIQVTAEAERINRKLAFDGWEPIVFEKRHRSHGELAELYRLADVCLVTSLHDGMNLVSKEYVAARHDKRGALVLSKFTGASRDLKGAIVVNPYSAEETAEGIYSAITMSPEEQKHRMENMQNAIKDYNVYRWSAELIKSVTSLG